MQIPESLLSRLNIQLKNELPDFLQALQSAPSLSIRLNPKKIIDHPYTKQVPWAEHGRYLEQRPMFTLDPHLHAGGYYVQEASSMLIEQAVKQNQLQQKALLALDLCAAPGGKSTHLISMLHQDSLLLSNEIIKSRAHILTENIIKWGYANVLVTQNDPLHFQKLEGLFDLIVIDAPCSGEGLIRKDPEALNEWSDNNLKLCAGRQQRIIADVWPALKEGGILIYSTCTFNPEENMQNLHWLFENYKATSLPLDLANDWSIENLHKKNTHAYQCWPHKVKGEGFFMSVIRKEENNHSVHLKHNKQKLSPANKSEKEIVTNWLKDPASYNLYVKEERLIALPKIHDELIQFLIHQLHVVHAGIPIGEIKKNKIVPQHALALSHEINPNAFANLELSKEQALAYLHRDSFVLENQALGFIRLCYQGLGLGWLNNLGNRVNNLYPANWRIRMDLK
jgi:16S rRNA C967 or C1407 C5-methylase (RsmB/RsmF family)/NOL1/NOP2/fmu family ribosome biogenesis protein